MQLHRGTPQGREVLVLTADGIVPLGVDRLRQDLQRLHGEALGVELVLQKLLCQGLGGLGVLDVIEFLHQLLPKRRLLEQGQHPVPLEPDADVQHFRVLGENLIGQEADRRQGPGPLRFLRVLHAHCIGNGKPADLIGKAGGDEGPSLLRGGGVLQAAEDSRFHSFVLIVVGGGDGQKPEERIGVRGPLHQLVPDEAGAAHRLSVSQKAHVPKVEVDGEQGLPEFQCLGNRLRGLLPLHAQEFPAPLRQVGKLLVEIPQQGLFRLPFHGVVKGGVQPVPEEGPIRKGQGLRYLRLVVLTVLQVDSPAAAGVPD